jgi:hypothetical protein
MNDSSHSIVGYKLAVRVVIVNISEYAICAIGSSRVLLVVSVACHWADGIFTVPTGLEERRVMKGNNVLFQGIGLVSCAWLQQSTLCEMRSCDLRGWNVAFIT